MLLIKFILISSLIIILLIFIGLWLAKSNADSEKLSPYECGMNPLGDARHKFRIDYILIGLLFVVFDLELTFLFPYIFILTNSILAYWGIGIFLLILTIGFIYEYTRGALKWPTIQ